MTTPDARRVAIGSWAPDYGSPVGTEAVAGDPGTATPADVDAAVEVPAGKWRPQSVVRPPAEVVRFVDGVRRIDARIWVRDDGAEHPGIAASCAAGVACCDDRAVIESCEVRRVAVVAHPSPPGLTAPGFGTYVGRSVEDASDLALSQALQDDMGALEQVVAAKAPPADLVVVDGPLRVRPLGAATVGYVKTHRTAYLSGAPAAVVGQLRPGERTPLFRISSGRWTKLSWYLRLPGVVDHPWEAVARLEVMGDTNVEAARDLADLSAATLPRFASQQYKDPRAPQNLHPIAALEQQLRRRLGDSAMAIRALRRGAAALG